MSFSIRSISKKGLKKNNKIKYSSKHKDAIKNPYGIVAPDSDDNSGGKKLHENNDSDNQANQLIEQNLADQENKFNQSSNDSVSGSSLNDVLQELSDIVSTVTSRLSQEEISQLTKDLETSEIGRELTDTLQRHKEKNLEDGVADPRRGFDGNINNEMDALIDVLTIVAALAPQGRAIWFAGALAKYIHNEFFKDTEGAGDQNDQTEGKPAAVNEDPTGEVKVEGTMEVEQNGTKRYYNSSGDSDEWKQLPIIVNKSEITPTEDYISPAEQKRIEELLKRLTRGLWRGDEVDKEDLISRHIPDKGVIGNQGNPRPWENDGTINWGELGKPKLKQDDSTKAHNGDEYVTDPPKDSGDGEGGAEPSAPPTGNGLRNISSDMNSSNSEMEGNTGLFKDFYQKAWVVTTDGEVDDITKHGKQVGDNSYRGWDMVAAEVIGGVNTAIWMHDNGKLSCWKLDSDWDYLGSKVHLAGSDGFSHIENQFATDFDKDGLIGSAPDGFM